MPSTPHPRCPDPKLWNSWGCYLTWYKGLWRYAYIKDFELGDYPGISRFEKMYPKNHENKKCRRTRKKKKRKCDHRNRGGMMTFKDGGRSQQPRNEAASRERVSQRSDSPLATPEEMQPCELCGLGLEKPISSSACFFQAHMEYLPE